MNAKEKQLLLRFNEIPKDVTPGFVLQLFYKGKLQFDLEWGKTWKYYDLASLTKIIFTTPYVIKAVDDKKINLSKSLTHYLPWFQYKQSIIHLLNHSAGNTWWLPFYKYITANLELPLKLIELKEIIRSQKPHVRPQAIYSDIDFLLLGFLLENVYEQNWAHLWAHLNHNYYNDVDIHFHCMNTPIYKRSLYAPTEKCPWRKRLLQGEVHDDNTWSMGGVAPHAGLFGDISSVAKVALQLRQSYRGEKSFLSTKNFRKFTRRSMAAEQGDWGLGFMLPTKGLASCGQHFSAQSFGHTGFTGTSLWIDPKRDVVIILLSNRVYPSRENESFRHWRPRIHDWCMEVLEA